VKVLALIVAVLAALFFAAMGTCCVAMVSGPPGGLRGMAWGFLPIWIVALFLVLRYIFKWRKS
jgi:hypothetical protein